MIFKHLCCAGDFHLPVDTVMSDRQTRGAVGFVGVVLDFTRIDKMLYLITTLIGNDFIGGKSGNAGQGIQIAPPRHVKRASVSY